jgi:cyclophilin family peptidyl-prolyl cis-trans isomerase
MAVRERSGLREPVPEEAGELSFLDRVNAFGERHARAIIIVSTALIIVTVLLFAQVLWSRTLFDRVERDLAASGTIEALESLRSRYAGTAAEPRVLATLGHRYAAEGKLKEALEVYDDFLKKYRGHILATGVNQSRAKVEENLKFLEEQRPGMLREPWLDVHPILSARVPGHPLRGGPIKEKQPVAVLKFKGRPEEVRIELFEDEAPNAVASFVSLAEQKYFEGLGFVKVNGDERLQIQPKKENPVTTELPFEPTNRPGDAGAVLLVRKGDRNSAAEFQILLKAVTDLKAVTVFGKVQNETGAAAIVPKLEEKDTIESIRFEDKRAHAYVPVYAKP